MLRDPLSQSPNGFAIVDWHLHMYLHLCLFPPLSDCGFSFSCLATVLTQSLLILLSFFSILLSPPLPYLAQNVSPHMLPWGRQQKHATVIMVLHHCERGPAMVCARCVKHRRNSDLFHCQGCPQLFCSVAKRCRNVFAALRGVPAMVLF